MRKNVDHFLLEDDDEAQSLSRSHPFKLLSLTPTFAGRVKRAATLHRGEKFEKAIYFLVA